MAELYPSEQDFDYAESFFNFEEKPTTEETHSNEEHCKFNEDLPF